MATVTGLTAERMLAIEAASVIDGDVVGDNLILTTKGGTQIDAGSVRGPVGPEGPVGSDLSLLSAVPVLLVGHPNQIRAGRQLTATDFTDMGLAAPLGLWNLSSLADSSGNGRNLSNKGAVPLGNGINGLPNTAAKMVGDASQVLYISATDQALSLRTGSIGCWFKTPKKGSHQSLIGKSGTASGYYMFELMIDNANMLSCWTSSNNTAVDSCTGTTDVCDDHWHFGVFTFDGAMNRLYIDGMFESSVSVSYPAAGPTVQVPFNIGGRGGDSSVVPVQSHWGSIDEAFITSDVLSEEQVRNLYCVKIPHALPAAPTRLNLNVRRYRKGGSLTASDFTTQPLRLHNFSGGSLGDEGSHAIPLLNNGGALVVSGADGVNNNAFNFNTSQNLYSADTGLPSGLSTRSYGVWFKVVGTGTTRTMLSWGSTTNGVILGVNNTGNIFAISYGSDQINGPHVADGQWHHAVVTENNLGDSGVRRRLYLDGRLVGFSGVMGSLVLGGANSFRVGGKWDGEMSWNFFGQVDSAFVTGYMLTSMEVQKLYWKGAQALAPSPKNVGDHIEAITATDLLATFDMLDANSRVDLTVAP